MFNNPLRKNCCAAEKSNFKITDYFILKFIKRLNKYKKIYMDGKYNNKVGGSVNNKIKFLSIYKFSIANENTNLIPLNIYMTIFFFGGYNINFT